MNKATRVVLACGVCMSFQSVIANQPAPSAPVAPQTAPAEKTVSIPGEFRKGEKADYQITIKVTKHAVAGDKTEQVAFPILVEVVDADKDGAVLSWTAKPPLTSAVPVLLVDDVADAIAMLNGYSPRVRLRHADESATLENCKDAKNRIGRVISDVLSIHKRAGLDEKDLEVVRKVMESFWSDDENVNNLALKIPELWYAPTYMSGPSGVEQSQNIEIPIGGGVVAKARRSTTFSPGPDSGARLVIETATDGKKIADAVVAMLTASGVKLTPAEIEHLRRDGTQGVHAKREYSTDKQGWLVKAVAVDRQRLASFGTTVETNVVRIGDVKQAEAKPTPASK